MRAYALFILILLLPATHALFIQETDFEGRDPAIYGENVAFEKEGVIYVYDILRKERTEIATGKNPSIFGFYVAFEQNDKIVFAHIKEKKITSTELIGKNPSIFANTIVFSTQEEFVLKDINKDNDMNDDVLREYDIETGEFSLLEAVGDYSSANQRFIVFTTDEKQINIDLNSDADMDDKILRVLDRETKKTSNVKIPAEKPIITKNNNIAFVSRGKIAHGDARTQEVKITEIEGENPAIIDSIILFDNMGKIYGYDTKKEILADTTIKGTTPVMFGKRAAYFLNEKLMHVQEEDIDGDDIPDFTDNCPQIPEMQKDNDEDGIGDDCDSEQSVEPEQTIHETEITTEQSEQPTQESSSMSLWWLLLLVLIIPIAIIYGPAYYRRRRKSFGF